MKKSRLQISFNMSQVKAKGSKIEKLMASELRKRKIKFRGNVRVVEGKPDFVIKGHKVAIFCDSHFWHGYSWKNRKLDHKSNKKFWLKKIERNMARDREVNKILRKQGWKVFRFWEHQILKHPDRCIERVKKYIHGY